VIAQILLGGHGADDIDYAQAVLDESLSAVLAEGGSFHDRLGFCVVIRSEHFHSPNILQKQ
jgi:hypothetical protein